MTIQEGTFFLLKKLRSEFSEGEAVEITDRVMEHITGSKKAERMIYKNSVLSVSEESELIQITERLLKNEPLQYILGVTWFYGLKFKVNKNVLIPRPETEELVNWIIEDIANYEQFDLNILDIGTGSGCIPITIKIKKPGAKISAIDVCSEAIYTATENAVEQNTMIDFILMDFLEEDNWKKLDQYDIIISNPPYVRQNEKREMHSRVKDFEPEKALFVPDNDALLFYKKISDFARTHLKPGGKLFFEINEGFGKDVVDMINVNGFQHVELRKDMQGKDRMISAAI